MSQEKIQSAGGKEFTVGTDGDEVALSWEDEGFTGGDALLPSDEAARLAAALMRVARKDGVALVFRPKGVEGEFAVLEGGDWKFLSFALDEAAEEMFHRDGFTPEDWASLEKLRRLVDGESS